MEEKQESVAVDREFNLRSKFTVKGRQIRVVKGEEDIVSNRFDRGEQVLLGSKKHLDSVKAAISEIENDIRRIQKLAKGDGTSGRMLSAAKVVKLENKKKEFEETLDFLLDNFDYLDEEKEAEEDEENMLEDDNEDNTFVVTKASVAESSKVHDIRIVRKWEAGPQVRQYYIGDDLYRQPGEVEVKWFELFLDLIYVGGVAKCGEHIAEHPPNGHSFDYHQFSEFTLVLIPLLFHWNHLCLLNNAIYHKGYIRKAFNFIFIVAVLFMTISISSAFDLSLEKNTGSVFLTFHVISIFLMESYTTYAMYKCVPNIGSSAFLHLIWVTLQAGMYMSIWAFPPLPETDNQIEADNRIMLRKYIWTAALIFEYASRFGVEYWKNHFRQPRIAVNVEHYHERFGVFIVFIMGELVVNLFKQSYTLEYQGKFLAYLLVVFVVSMNIFFLYFRSEGNEYFVHALRRKAPRWATIWRFTQLPFSVAIVGLGAANAALLRASENQLYPKGLNASEHGGFFMFNETNTTNITSGMSCPGAESVEFSLELQDVFFACFAGIYGSLALFGMVHKEKIREGYHPLVPLKYRVVQRIFWAAVFCAAIWVVPKLKEDGKEFHGFKLLYYALGITSFSVIFEELGRYSVKIKSGKVDIVKRE
ncbi:hypothetical protein HK103_006620 [Boothiomyces macroporosus]|uniref:Uncharacterized protein n=1 Tax=Boothiomyces macroporosus TaxID=261099 RepID=A0AAD5UGQ3_9FUNG|nr:hypothetical protein HK103_006620 [Boothiomyces macroporosus]